MKTKSILFCLLFAVCVNIHTAKAQVNVQDSLALVDLYNNTDGPNWRYHDHWLTSSPVSTWFGITVTKERVTQISLYENNLEGNIPSSIGNLVYLDTLDLSLNQLSGRIPSSISNLINLYILDLQDNQLTGSIPSSLGNLINLQTLSLSDNQLTGSIPSSLGNLINLQTLSLSDNQLTGGIPSSLGDLTELKNLFLTNNKLTGSIPSSIGNLVNLSLLFLNNNKLSGSIPSSISNLKKLQFLYLNSNQLSGGIPSSITAFYINLSNNQLSGRIPSSIFGGSINLSNNQLSGHIPSFDDLEGIRGLFLNKNRLSGNIPSSIGNIRYLLNLKLTSNQLSGSIPSSIGNLQSLQSLDLSNNQLSDSIPSSLGNLVKLHYLLLNNNRLSGSIPSSLGNLKHGIRLNLKHNYFTFDGMEFVEQTFPWAVYFKQKRIPIHQNGNTLSVSAGGTLSNNTYKWYRFRKEGDTIIIKGDSVFHPTQSGKYLVRVKNSIATQLTLYSDTIVYVAPAVIASAENSLQQYDKTNSFGVYPNPARDILFVQTNSNASFSLLNQSGKILLTKNVNGKGSINISGIAAGLYYLKNNSTEAVQKVIIAR